MTYANILLLYTISAILLKMYICNIKFAHSNKNCALKILF